MGRKGKLPLIERLEIIDVAAEGKSIGKYNDMVVFVPYLIPGDIADIQVVRKRKRFMEGYVVAIHEYSKDRIEPFCSHFGVCGGCKWQNLPYDKQLYFKQKQVSDNLTRIGKISIPPIHAIKPSEKTQYYRNKLEYTFSSSRWLTNEEIGNSESIADRDALGFHIPGKFDKILDIKNCFLQDDLSNKIRLAVKQFAVQNKFSFYTPRENVGFMRNLIIRNTNTGEWMVIVVFGDDKKLEIESLLNHIMELFPQITALFYVINTKVNDTIGDLDIQLFSGRDHIIEEMEGLKFKIGPKSFFQTNSGQALNLYKETLRLAGLTGDEVVYDLYTGTGTIANFVSAHCKKVIGIEYVEDAIIDARLNSATNNIQNAEFFSGDMKDILTPGFIQLHGQPDVIITDPPRAGMHADVVKVIEDARAKYIIYVSCNPATQARDLELLSETYRVTEIQPFDMFPHTHHVENIVKLELI